MNAPDLLPHPTFLTYQDFVDLRKSIQALNVPRFDPAVFAKGLEIAAFFIKDGCADFLAFSRRMIADVGECIRPYLKSLYSAARYCPGIERYATGMSPVDFVHLVNVNMISGKDGGEERLYYAAKVAVSLIEDGTVSIYGFATKMIEKLGEDIRPYITPAYEAARKWFINKGKEAIWKQMDPYDEVDEFNEFYFDKPLALKNSYYAPKDPGFLTIARHGGVLTRDDILENLLLMRIMSEQFEKHGEVDALWAMIHREILTGEGYNGRDGDLESYFYDPYWEHVWEKYDLNPNKATTREGLPIVLYPLEEAFAQMYSYGEKTPSKEEAKDLMIEMLEDSFLQRFWVPDCLKLELERESDTPHDDSQQPSKNEGAKKSGNFLKNKYKSFEEGLVDYLDWKESWLEPYDKPVSEEEKASWAARFRDLWDLEELTEVWN